MESVFSVMSLTFRYHCQQRGTCHHWSVVIWGFIWDLQTDRPLLLFALYFITGTEISENLQGILRIYS